MDTDVDRFASMCPEEFEAFFAKVQQKRLARQVPRQPEVKPGPLSAPDPVSSFENEKSTSGRASSSAEVSSQGLPADTSSQSEVLSGSLWGGSGSLLTASSDHTLPDGSDSVNSSVPSDSEPDAWDNNSGSEYDPNDSDSEVASELASAISDGDNSAASSKQFSGSENGSMRLSNSGMSTNSSDDSDGESITINSPPSVESLTYHPKPLSSAMKTQLTQDLNQRINYHGHRSLRSKLNLAMFGSNGLTQCIEQPGSWIVSSPEQSGKTVGEAALALTSMRMGHPSILVVKDVKGNARKVSDDLAALLSPSDFGMTVIYASGMKIWDTIRNACCRSNFRSGKLLVVISAHKADLEHLNDFLEDFNMTGLTVIADESDNIWSTEVIPGVSFRANCCQREKQMYRLLSSATDPAGRLNPLASGSRVRSLIQVSATHIATIVWHCQWRLPFRYVCADKSRLIERGYALEHDIKLVATLDPDEIKASNDYGLRSTQVVNELETFCQDSRNGRMMMVCLSPYVNKLDTMTVFAIAHVILQHYVKDAICIVMHGGGVNALYNSSAASSSSAADYSCGKGEVIYVDDAKQRRALKAGSQASAHQRRRTEQAIRSKQASDAIKRFDKKFGQARPHLVIGYSVVGRCASIRSRDRVITHVIGAYQRGRSKADAEQMLLRSNGKSRKIRAKNGFHHVRMVTTEESFWIVQDLYNFTEKALQMSGTGRQEDLMNWYKGDYPENFKPLFRDKHPWYRKSMGTLDSRGMRISGEPICMEEFPMPKRPKRKPSGSVKRQQRVDPESTIARLMRCIWAVAASSPEKHFKRADLDTWIQDHPNIITREEYVGRQHSHSWSIISSRCHYIRKINKAIRLYCLTDKGVKWYKQHLLHREGHS
ncbi:hypothetical protein WJX74_004321 [Apatococcus lobatus]|uniref:Uncharacterized protein n=1 Tax=Apatococcus lobatus TaxID=904363 RepID=A0AAW1R0F3_9CHLO